MRPPLEALLDLGRARHFEKGDALACEGDLVDSFWLVKAGTVRVYHLSVDGRDHEVGRFGPGSLVGAALAFSSPRFPYFVDAVEDGSMISFPREAAWNRIVDTPELAAFFLRAISARCHALQDKTCETRSLPMRERLLLQLSRDCGKDGNCHASRRPKKDIAAALGTTPETLSRLLRMLVEEGVIAMEGRAIRIVDCRRGCRGERAGTRPPI